MSILPVYVGQCTDLVTLRSELSRRWCYKSQELKISQDNINDLNVTSSSRLWVTKRTIWLNFKV